MTSFCFASHPQDDAVVCRATFERPTEGKTTIKVAVVAHSMGSEQEVYIDPRAQPELFEWMGALPYESGSFY